jgi:hypothetical protein
MSNSYTDIIISANSINTQAAALVAQLKTGSASASVISQCDALVVTHTAYTTAKTGLIQKSDWVAIQSQMADIFVGADSNIAIIKNFLAVYRY